MVSLKSLFPRQYNWHILALVLIAFRMMFINISWSSYFAVAFSLYQFSLLFDSVGKFIPTRHLFGSLMCLQFFIGPSLAYNGLDAYQYFMYQMKIPEGEYFAYAIPAVMAFIIGLHLRAEHEQGERLDLEAIRAFEKRNPLIGPVLIGVGFMASLVSRFFSAELEFIFYLIGSFKFIGLFLLIIGEKKLNWVAMALVLGSIVSSSLGTGMFHDLLTWIIYSSAILAQKFNIGIRIKLIGLFFFIFLATTIQLLKSDYRLTALQSQDKAGIETFAQLYQQENENQGVFNFEKMAQSNVRINQGFIITNIMHTVPDKVPFANGSELAELLKAAFLPRFLAPDKLKAGDRSIFKKYSGIPIASGTSMGLSSLGDAYVNFGIAGGVLFMFLLGFMYSEILRFFFRSQRMFPLIVIFSPLVFYYPIRPDCELHTILGHLFKSIVVIFTVFLGWRHVFQVSATAAFPAHRRRKPTFPNSPEQASDPHKSVAP
jgi:hypothetical protein